MKTFEEVLQEGKHAAPETWDNRSLVYDKIEGFIKEYINVCRSLAKEKGESPASFSADIMRFESKLHHDINEITDKLIETWKD